MLEFIAVLTFVFIILILLPKDQRKWKKLLSGPSLHQNRREKSPLIQLLQIWTNAVLFVLSFLNLNRVLYAKRGLWEERLSLAGMGQKWTAERFLGLKTLSAFLAYGYFLFLGFMSENALYSLLGLIAVLLGFVLPDQFLKARIRKRKGMISKELPHFINSLAIMCEAGLNLFPAIKELTRDNPSILGEELKTVVHEVSAGYSQKEAFERLTNRCQVDELSRFVSAIVQNIERGSSGITQILRNQASDAWEARKQEAQKLGEQASLKLFFPLILLAFPAMMIFVLGPVFMELVKFVFTV